MEAPGGEEVRRLVDLWLYLAEAGRLSERLAARDGWRKLPLAWVDSAQGAVVAPTEEGVLQTRSERAPGKVAGHARGYAADCGMNSWRGGGLEEGLGNTICLEPVSGTAGGEEAHSLVCVEKLLKMISHCAAVSQLLFCSAAARPTTAPMPHHLHATPTPMPPPHHPRMHCSLTLASPPSTQSRRQGGETRQLMVPACPWAQADQTRCGRAGQTRHAMPLHPSLPHPPALCEGRAALRSAAPCPEA